MRTLNTCQDYGKLLSSAFFVVPGGRFYEVGLFAFYEENKSWPSKVTLVRRWGKYGSKGKGLVREYTRLHFAQTKFSHVMTEKKYQKWRLVEDNPVDRLAALTILAEPAKPGIPTNYRHRPNEQTCTCDEYPFPHRLRGGKCEGYVEPPDDDYDYYRPYAGRSLYGAGYGYGRYC